MVEAKADQTANLALKWKKLKKKGSGKHLPDLQQSYDAAARNQKSSQQLSAALAASGYRYNRRATSSSERRSPSGRSKCQPRCVGARSAPSGHGWNGFSPNWAINLPLFMVTSPARGGMG